jgi:AsmA protein
MKRPRQSLRRYSLALATLFSLVFVVAAPILISDRYSHIVLRSAAVFAASANSYSLSAPVRLLQAPMIELEGGTLSVPPTRTGLARGGQMIAMLITGSGPQMTLENATFTADFSTSEPTFSNGSAHGEVAPLVSALKTMQFDGLAVRDSSVRIKMSDGSTLEFDEVTAEIASKPNGAIQATGSFVFRGEKVAFETALGASLDPQGNDRPVTASFASAPLSATLDGSLMLGDSPQLLSPQAELTIVNLRDAARWLGVNWPSGRGFGAFHAKGQLEWGNRTLAFQRALVQMDDNEAAGTLSVNFSGARPALEGTLGLKTLDLSKYLKPAAAASAAAPDAAAVSVSLLSALSAASGLEFPLIQSIDADLRISSDRVALPGATIGHSAVTISLKENKMLADIAELEIDEGTRGGGQIRIDMSGPNPSFGVQGKLEVMDVGRVAQVMFGHPTVQGRGVVTVDLSAVGNTGDSLLRSLGGKLCVTLNEGGRIGLDINQLTAAANAPQPSSAWQAASARAISVDKLDARFVVADGVIRTQSAEAVSGARALKADGAISLLERRLDLELAIGDLAKADIEGGEPKLQPRDVIDVHGPWSEPTLRVGPADARQFGPPNPG